jgi:hypothetical protein
LVKIKCYDRLNSGWAGRKYKRLRSYMRFTRWWRGVVDRDPGLFTQWRWVRTFAGFQRLLHLVELVDDRHPARVGRRPRRLDPWSGSVGATLAEELPTGSHTDR